MKRPRPIGRALFDAEAGEPLFVELGDGTTRGPFERTVDEIRDLPETDERDRSDYEAFGGPAEMSAPATA
jgi:hypothetical protein